jgi:hypothetical protein
MNGVSFILRRSGSGVVETSDSDIFDEDYIKAIHDLPGIYRVMMRTPHKGYTTVRKIREVEVKAENRVYRAPSDDEPSSIDTLVSDSEPSASSVLPSSSTPDEFTMVRAPDNTYKIIDYKGNVIQDGFTLDQLKASKKAAGAGDGPINDSDLKNKQIMQCALAFFAGAAVGGVAVFLILDSRYKKQIDELNQKMVVMQGEMERKIEASSVKKKMPGLSDFEDEMGGRGF